jgi:cell surface protein SprA
MQSTESDLGNVISGTRAWQVDGGINFETLYNKSKYWKEMSQHYNQRSLRRRTIKPKTYTEIVSLKGGEPKEIVHRLGSESLKISATTRDGKSVKLNIKPTSNTKAEIKSKEDLQNITITITTVNKSQRSPGQVTVDMLAHIGTMFRKLQVTYRNTNSLTIPGFAPQAGFMGQQRFNDLYAPGFDFAFGAFGDDFVEKAKNNGWLSSDTTVVQPASRTNTNDFDVKVTLEPFPGFKIQVNGKRYEAESSSIIYSFDQLQENMTGSFNITQVAIGTAFQRIGNADENFASEVFDQFLSNRDIMTGRVQEQYEGMYYPNAGFIPA